MRFYEKCIMSLEYHSRHHAHNTQQHTYICMYVPPQILYRKQCCSCGSKRRSMQYSVTLMMAEVHVVHVCK